MTRISRRALLAAASLFALQARAQAWPVRPIRFVVPGPAGAGSDIFARLIATPLQEVLKQPVVIDNKVGANGLIGNDAVAKAPNDGYTILLSPSSAIAINPIIQPKMPYDTLKDLLPVTQVGAAGILLIAHPSTGFKSLADMVRFAKANPEQLAYGSWGSGSTGHLVMEGIKAHYGLAMPHVPYKGVAPLVNDVLGNNLRVGFADIASPVPHIKAGKLTALGATGSARGPALPDLPTLTEQGYKFDADGWYGIFAPAGTPQATVDRFSEALAKVVAMPEVRERLTGMGLSVGYMPQQQFATRERAYTAAWTKIIKSSGFVPQ